MDRKRRRLLGVVGLSVLGLAAWLALRLSPRENLPPARGVRTQVRFDLGPWARGTLRARRIQEGDTLGHVAVEHLGGLQGVEALRQWNPELDPRALPLGKVLWLPPEPPGSVGASPWVFWIWRRQPLGGEAHLERVPAGGGDFDVGPAGLHLLAAPAGEALEIERFLQASPGGGQPPVRGDLVISPPLAGAAGVAAGIETHTVRQAHILRGLGASGMRLETAAEPLDAKGRPVLVEGPPAGFFGPPGLLSAVALLSVLAALLLSLSAGRPRVGERTPRIRPPETLDARVSRSPGGRPS